MCIIGHYIVLQKNSFNVVTVLKLLGNERTKCKIGMYANVSSSKLLSCCTWRPLASLLYTSEIHVMPVKWGSYHQWLRSTITTDNAIPKTRKKSG